MKNRSRWFLVWAIWLATIAATFGVLEAMAWNNGVTLSRFVWDLGEAWPLFIWLCGALTGGLAVHFWWHWSPSGSKSEG